MSSGSSSGPHHVAIIMDGNGRWAEKQGKIRTFGHERGGEQVKTILKAAHELGISQLTLYAFSTENWKRPKTEVVFLNRLLVRFLKRETEALNKDNVRFVSLGDIERFPAYVQKQIADSKERLKNNTGITLCLALSYGSRAEICSATRQFAEDCQKGIKKPEDINEELFNNYLQTAAMPELDLLIRTAGEQRISNFLLWQLSYAELYFVQALWPDFSKEDLKEAVDSFRKRERRFGGLQKK